MAHVQNCNRLADDPPIGRPVLFVWVCNWLSVCYVFSPSSSLLLNSL